MKLLALGTAAPLFRLPITSEQSLALHDLRGRRVVLLFHPSCWHPVSCEQLVLYQALLPTLGALDATLLAIGADTVWSQNAFARAHGVGFPLLADCAPLGGVARRYRVARADAQLQERALFVLDEGGRVQWRDAVPNAVNPGVDGLLTALERLGRRNGSAWPSQN